MTVAEMSRRSLEIFQELVDAYVETGEPVGSRTLSKRLKEKISPATIRNIMADLEDSGLLYAPHTSAGRLPTEAGMRFFVQGLLEIGGLDIAQRSQIEQECRSSQASVESILDNASRLLSGLSQCVSIVAAPKIDAPLMSVEFLLLNPGRALVVLVSENGVENRLIEIPPHVDLASLSQAGKFISSHLRGKTLMEARELLKKSLMAEKNHLDELTTQVIEAGLAVWGGDRDERSLIVSGQSNLLEHVTALEELETIRLLFQQLETKESLYQLIDSSIYADGVQIFIGSESQLFKLTGCSLIVSPYRDAGRRIVGAIGVIGPTRMNYRKIIPLVDYTAKFVGRLIR